MKSCPCPVCFKCCCSKVPEFKDHVEGCENREDGICECEEEWKCQGCGQRWDIDEIERDETDPYPYCPTCGFKLILESKRQNVEVGL